MKNHKSKTLIKPYLAAICLVFIGLACSRDFSITEGITPVEFKATASTQLITVGETVTFVDSSLNVASRQWTISLGPSGEVTSTEEMFDVTYPSPASPGANPGTFNGFPATLQVTYEDGRVQQNTFNVTVFPRIELDFTSDLDTALFGSTVQFTNMSQHIQSQFVDTRELDSIVWEFPGGTPATSSQENPSVTYSTPGVYDVTLRAHRQGPEDDAVLTRTDAIVILAALPLVPDFTSDVTEISADQSVTFSDASAGGPTEYLWTFEGGTPATSTEANPTVTYEDGGFFDVTLQITRGSDGATETISRPDFIFVDSPFCNTPDNLLGCGNNDGEGSNLIDWRVFGPANVDRTDRLSISMDQANGGAASIRLAFDEGSAATFQNNDVQYFGKQIEVTEAGSYTVTSDLFADILSSGTEFVGELQIRDATNATANAPAPNRAFFRTTGGQWFTQSLTADLTPGIYIVNIRVWNPPFHADLNMNLFIDNVTAVRN